MSIVRLKTRVAGFVIDNRSFQRMAVFNGDMQMVGDEKRIVDAFCKWLEQEGCTIIKREGELADIVAERGEYCLYAEAKGQTTSIGLDVDTLYGQLLRRMTNTEVGKTRFAVVVPTEALKVALRVSSQVRELLNIDVYGVDSQGKVTLSK